MKKLYSFDIFDTCLVRTCGNPRNVFDILAASVLRDYSDISARNDFILIRMNAERKAREELINGENEEITLEDIYRYCDFNSITTIDNNTIMEMELNVEEKILLPVEKVRNKIEQLIIKGAKVVYISDMYLPLGFIDKILRRSGFYVNQNIYLSSSIKKTKSSGHLYDYVFNDTHIKGGQWQHTGDNKYSDFIIPKKKGIIAKLLKHEYNQYELKGMELLHDGVVANSFYPFSLSKAIRLSLPNTPNTIFASTFIAPMFVSYVYHILCDSRKRGIKHLFFLARDGYILYHIAQEFSKQFPDICLSYLYVSRQALYMAGLNEVSAKCIKESLPYLKKENLFRILYDLHLSSYDYSHLPINNINGEQLIDLLFSDNTFVEALRIKHNEQNNNIIKYFQQEGLVEGKCAIVDVVGSRRCQSALNNILIRHNYPEVFAYYFEVTLARITRFQPYLAMNYQDNVFNTRCYNRASQPLYEQFFAISNHKRTIEYQDIDGTIEPVFETDFMPEEYKQKIFEINKTVCTLYAKHYAMGYIDNPVMVIQTAQKVFASFCYAPRKEFLQAIDSFICTGSGEPNETLLNKKSFIYTITHIKQFYRWPEGQLIYSSGWLYPLVLKYLNYRYKRKQR